jgi:hypothetical protein
MAAELAPQSGRKVATGDREVKRSAEIHGSPLDLARATARATALTNA